MKIEWLDDKKTRALVTETLGFWNQYERCTEAELREKGTYKTWVWYHAGSDVPLPGEVPMVGADYTFFPTARGTSYQRALTKARCKWIRGIKDKSERDIERIRRAEEREQWKSPPPRASVVISNCRAQGDIIAVATSHVKAGDLMCIPIPLGADKPRKRRWWHRLMGLA